MTNSKHNTISVTDTVGDSNFCTTLLYQIEKGLRDLRVVFSYYFIPGSFCDCISPVSTHFVIIKTSGRRERTHVFNTTAIFFIFVTAGKLLLHFPL